jgi:hypothetical protein
MWTPWQRNKPKLCRGRSVRCRKQHTTRRPETRCHGRKKSQKCVSWQKKLGEAEVLFVFFLMIFGAAYTAQEKCSVRPFFLYKTGPNYLGRSGTRGQTVSAPGRYRAIPGQRYQRSSAEEVWGRATRTERCGAKA